MAEIKLECVARVTVQLEIKVHSHWGPGASVKQVYDQAVDDALGMIRNAKNGPKEAQRLVEASRTLGEPKVTAIIVDGEK